MRLPAFVLLAPLTLALAGCSVMTTTSTPGTVTGAAITGKVHGGQQPIVGSHVYLFAANTTGYGGSGIAPSPTNASISLLTSATGHADTLGNYVLTDVNGSFTITADYTCTGGQQVYLYALGGNPAYPGGATNSAIGELAILGSCPAAGTFPASKNVIVNELSTVAAAYAFAAFASDATHVSSSGTALAQSGIANAFANAANLVSLAGGYALTTTPAGNGIVLTAEINTFGNILAACVNSSGPAATSCSTLFSDTPSLTTTPVTPADTANAAINIAHNPTANVDALLTLTTPNAPFAPAFTNYVSSFSMFIQYYGLQNPTGIAIDRSGNAWIANTGGNNVVEFSSSGSVLSGTHGFTGGGLNSPRDVAIDPAGNVWLANYLGAGVSELSSSGGPISGPGGFPGVPYPIHIVVDAAGSAWATEYYYHDYFDYSGSVTKFSSSGIALFRTNGPDPLTQDAIYGGTAIDGAGIAWAAKSLGRIFSNGMDLLELSSAGATLNTYQPNAAAYGPTPTAVAIDSRGTVWVASSGSPASVTAVSHTGTNPLSVPYATGGNLDSPDNLAIDGAGNVWVTNSDNTITEISSSGAILQGFPLPTSQNNGALAIDGSGNLWTSSNYNGGTVYQVVGAAAPVITPIAAALPLIPTTDGSSLLGTRP